MEKFIVYDNRKFSLGTTKRYYFAHKQGKSISLHRYKYEKEIGPIPEGCHIHHKDGNCFNNEVYNLIPIEPKKHSELHPPSEENIKKWHTAGIKAAPVWHASKEGFDWHRKQFDEHIRAKWDERVKRPCSFCGKEFDSKRKSPDINAFCHNKCKSAWRRKFNPDMITKNCPTCNKEYETLKYLPTKYCSAQCKPAPNPFGKKRKNKLP